MRHDRSQFSLDCLNFFIANVQTGFGAFIAVYLTANRWTQAEIGIALSVGTVASMASQIPAGALVDALRDKRLAAALAIGAIIGSAMLFAVWPERLPVMIAELLHGFASCMLTPAIAAITLTLIRAADAAERFGRNARWASVGNAVAAAAMGAIGYAIGLRSVFVFTALLALPALATLPQLRSTLPRHEAHPAATLREPPVSLRQLLLDYRLLAFGVCTFLFQLTNAAMLPLAAGEVTKRAGAEASLIIAACIVGPQLVVAAFSPWVGRSAEAHGRKILLLVGFAVLPLRALLLAATANPYLVVLIMALDGVGAAAFGVLTPLITADITRGTGRFNLCMGAFGLAGGVGATISTALAGATADDFGNTFAFLMMAASGVLAVLAAWCMPETRQRADPAALR
jgi:MFS family permease